ncbi:MAG: ABC transporter substrate-binding protein, partial [candidate division NC10 bacterium]|nr:ABC transporter substrate-binding protein [candidate division NC10 bacterium]
MCMRCEGAAAGKERDRKGTMMGCARRYLWGIGLLLGISILLSALPAEAAEPIRIGAIFSVTGPASFLGEPERNTAKMLEEDLNRDGGLLGRKVEVIVYDDESDATKAVTAVDRLVKRDRVAAIVGPSTSGSSLAIISKIEEAQIPLLSCAAAKKIADPVKRWVFKTPQNDQQMAIAIAAHMANAGVKTVAFIGFNDAYGEGWYQEFI